MTFTETIKTAVVHDCPCMKEVISVPVFKVATMVVTSAAIGYVCGVGIKRISIDIGQVMALRKAKKN